MDPRDLYLGPRIPAEQLSWQEPIADVDHDLIDESDIDALKSAILATGLSMGELVSITWALRGLDKRGGTDGARIRLAPQKVWGVKQPTQLSKVLAA